MKQKDIFPKSMLSDIYDSTVQRAYLNRKHLGNSDKVEGEFADIYSVPDSLKKYEAVLRWDILLFGSVTLTDAMWYDGMLFSFMVQYKELDAFKRFITKERNGTYPVYIAQRSNYLTMFCKRLFYYSSVQDSELQKKLMDVSEELGKWSEDFQSTGKDICLTSFFDILRTKIQMPLDLLENQLKELSDDAFANNRRMWEKGRFAYMDFAYQNTRKMVEDYNNRYGGLSGKLGEIRNEISRDKPDRSYIIYLLENCSFHDELWRGLADALGTTFRKDYNIAIAEQHRCYFIDQYEDFERSYMEGKMDNRQLLYHVLESLKDMTWDEFAQLYDQSELVSIRDRWLISYKEMNEQSESDITDDWNNKVMEKKKNAAKDLASYVECLLLALKEPQQCMKNHILFYARDGVKTGVERMLVPLSMDLEGVHTMGNLILPRNKLHLFEVNESNMGLKLHAMCREIKESANGGECISVFKDFFEYVRVPENGALELERKRMLEAKEQ